MSYVSISIGKKITSEILIFKLFSSVIKAKLYNQHNSKDFFLFFNFMLLCID